MASTHHENPLPVFHPLIALAIGALPIGHWYLRRMGDGSDEPWGLLALAAALLFVPWKKLKQAAAPESWWLTGATLLLLALSRGHLPMLLRASLPVMAAAWLLFRSGAPFAIHGLCFLSLPWMATLQFYLGYPLRAMTGKVAATLLQISGYEVHSVGTILQWQQLRVIIDQPCAGISMLWFGSFLTYLLACLYDRNWKQTLRLGILSLCAILAANILRNYLLFFMSTGIWKLPHWCHEGIGWSTFMLVALPLLRKPTTYKTA